MRFCQAIRVLIEKYEYDALHKYQTYGMFQTFQTTHPAGFSAVVPIFQRQKVDHRRLYSASEKLMVGFGFRLAYIVRFKS